MTCYNVTTSSRDEVYIITQVPDKLIILKNIMGSPTEVQFDIFLTQSGALVTYHLSLPVP